ncbi:aminopeptidase O isoform X3 [Hypanus sabinus]|uniref:aminopeptidase O isoform X3 n=1 Tax=Hypanus sabinus TaxID=79690 RepID=UPI0028C45232|nr:aminopeptidase O isoform X3 [Hypanus sabinus]
MLAIAGQTMNENTNSALDPNKDDLPLMANTGCMLVRHYVLDLAVNFDREVINGTIALFLETNKVHKRTSSCVGAGQQLSLQGPFETEQAGPSCCLTYACEGQVSNQANQRDGRVNSCNHSNNEWAGERSGARELCDDGKDFVLVLDCCDLVVTKVEEVNVTAAAGTDRLSGMDVLKPEFGTLSQGPQDDPQNSIVDEILGLSAERWREQHNYYIQCSNAPGSGELQFQTDTWSMKIRKPGIQSPQDFPRVLRIWYETKPEGDSVKWTKDQSGRPCVYTAGSPINNRALFPCQEPPVAMATWQASILAPTDTVVLMSGENCAEPHQAGAFSKWFYYVTMPMPASTFTLAVGFWLEVKHEHIFESHLQSSLSSSSNFINKNPSVSKATCDHPAYPCRFQNPLAQVQDCIPHRVFAPDCLNLRSQEFLLPLLAPCLSAACRILGTHPFCRVDVLVVPAGFSSLGMASPHIIFLSQSVLSGGIHLCGIRLCHEIAHAWFGLAIGARDWTEEWISEGFATYLEDIFWAKAQKLSQETMQEQQQLRSLLRWRRLREEIQNSEEELQVLRPNKENTGEVNSTGATIIKHGRNPGKVFMQVHYLKGYFLLHYLENQVGQKAFLNFLGLFVERFHGQLILSQDFLHMFMENFSELGSQGLSTETIYRVWLDVAGLPKQPPETHSACPSSPTETMGEQVICEGREVRIPHPFSQLPGLHHQERVWRSFCQALGAYVSLSFGFHPQKNGQTEQVNQDLEAVLHCTTINNLSTWGDHLAWVQYAHNSLLLPDQLVLLLEFVLEMKSLSSKTLQRLQKQYSLREQDAEVRHRWCELVIKHKLTVAYRDLINFLKQDQAMGVYIYGELMVNEDARQQQLAHRCFAMLKEEMDPSLKKVVTEMLF